MSESRILSHQESILVTASAAFLYDLLSDITRTGEWSPVCTSCWWDDEAEAGRVGAWFTGHNELPHRTWETRSEVVTAEHGREFAWVVGGSFVRWDFSFTAAETGTVLTESWEFLPDGIAMFEDKFGEDAPAQITDRTHQAFEGIPKTLAAIKRIAEASTDVRAQTPS
ncbi:SRPBCC family protein [Cryobacterium melibiosiphilum]|uniref:SRPBCC family protein n=1 Tax=Cryobacterium melibiosiphilum TaxID=995039 RepID=A0A3A5MMH1_9MICO|nr:SRPBCC family protein [Cryobacterium melibiosiphilum]RJT91307.1 SRPBCC family protein [Cryobacterium melibiosiphilum]